MLRMLKQARAFGVGQVLVTQNPVDMDYKALSNAGSWFIGKLQTENDRKKMMTGLDSLAESDAALNIGDVRDVIAELDPRVFLMHNVHDESGPALFHTRWAMSYLRGPLTRRQISTLMTPPNASAPSRGGTCQRPTGGGLFMEAASCSSETRLGS